MTCCKMLSGCDKDSPNGTEGKDEARDNGSGMHLVGFGCFGKRLVVVCVVKKEDGWVSGRDRRLLDTGRDEKIG
jgi:hypothetical protein